MNISIQSRRTLLGLVLAASAAGTIAQAQSAADRPLPVPPPPGGGQGELVVNCCRCLGGESGAVSLNTGTAPWRVSSVASATWAPNALTGPTNTSPLIVPGAVAAHSAWTTTLAPAQWLQPSTSTTRNDGFPNGHVTYVLKVRVPNCSIKQKVTIAGKIAADDKALMFVDGPGGGAVPFVPAGHAGFATAWQKTFSYQLGANSAGFTQPGVYTVRVEVDILGGGPFGMALNGTAGGKCDDRLVKDKEDRADCRDC